MAFNRFPAIRPIVVAAVCEMPFPVRLATSLPSCLWPFGCWPFWDVAIEGHLSTWLCTQSPAFEEQVEDDIELVFQHRLQCAGPDAVQAWSFIRKNVESDIVHLLSNGEISQRTAQWCIEGLASLSFMAQSRHVIHVAKAACLDLVEARAQFGMVRPPAAKIVQSCSLGFRTSPVGFFHK